MANNTLLASDNFASGSLAAGWAAATGIGFSASQVTGSPFVAEGNVAGTISGQFWTGLSWPGNQVNEVTVTVTVEAGSQIYLMTRCAGLSSPSTMTGYYAFIANNAAQIYRLDAGFGTSTLLATVSGLTFAAGDVWAMECAGSFIGLYQNGARIIFAADATYATGIPGFLQVGVTNVSHCKVLSWRGYSTAQPVGNGIWQKHGIVLPSNAGDQAGVGGIGTPSTILYEGNSQLGLGAGNVYKVWFQGGGSTSAAQYYAESLDGVSWTRKAAPVLSGFAPASYFKNGSTYYMYTQQNSASGSGVIYLYTSPDGITWTQVSTDVFGGALSGTYTLQPIAIIAGTWYGIYGYFVSNIVKTGLATSSNGVTWTKYASNPVLSGVFPTGCYAKVGSTYYVWFCEATPSAQSSSHAYLFDPTNSIRYQTTDFIHWTNPVQSIARTQMSESLNGYWGQVVPAGILDVNGVANMWYDGTPGDSDGTCNGQIALAIAPASIANIIQEKEDACQQVAMDAFTSGAGPLSANWTTPTGSVGLQIVSGPYCEASAGSYALCMGVYTGATVSPDQYSEVTVHTIYVGSYMGPIVRGQAGSEACYGCNMNSTGLGYLYATDGSSYARLSPNAPLVISIGDVLRISVVGKVVSWYQNGSLVIQGLDETNLVPSTGYPGILLQVTSATDSSISLWAGGNANVMPFGIISGNAGVAGATISYSGATSGSVTADGSGNYTLPNLANGMYTITPTKAGVAFNPSSSTESISNGNIAGVTFTATLISNSKNSLLTTNNLLLTNGLIVTNTLLAPNLLGGIPDWS